MPKKHRTGLRMFKADLQSGLVVVPETDFPREKQMQRFVESSIGTLFPGLVFLATEFGRSDGGRFRPDTIAFDEANRTFVIIEYKNKLEEGVTDQARSYLNHMRNNHFILETLYEKAGQSKQKWFNWKGMYAIVVAPEFSERQIEGNRTDPGLELHEIRLYGEHAVTVERVSGAHVGGGGQDPATDRSHVNGQDDPKRKGGSQDGDGKRERFRQEVLSDTTRPLFDYVDGSLRERFALRSKFGIKQVNYGPGSEGDILWLYGGMTQLKLWYADAGEDLLGALNDALASSGTDRDSGFYKSKIKTEQDFEKIVPLIEHVIRHAQELQ